MARGWIVGRAGLPAFAAGVLLVTAGAGHAGAAPAGAPAAAPARVSAAPARPQTEEQMLKAAYALAQQALKQASALVTKRQYRQARVVLEPLEQNPDPTIRWPATFWRARSYHDERNPTAAIPLFEEVALNYEPLAAQCEYWMGQGWVRLGMLATAREHFQRGADLDKGSTRENCLYQIAYSYYQERRYERAVRLFREFVEAYPTSSFVDSACTLTGTSEERMHAARHATLQFTGGIGLASGSQIIRSNAPLELGLGANARLGTALRWDPRDGMHVAASVYGTRTSYVTGSLRDRAGIVGRLSFSHDLDDARTFSYGFSYTTNQQVDVVASDSSTYGLNASYSMPFARDGRLGAGLSVSRLRYHSALSSGTQSVFSTVYTEPISRLATASLAAGLTRSDVGAGYLSYSGFSLSGSVTQKVGRWSSLRGGISHTVNDFDDPAPRRTFARSDHTRRIFAEWTQKITSKISVTVGWEENKRGSNQVSLNRNDPSWYVRTSELFDLHF